LYRSEPEYEETKSDSTESAASQEKDPLESYEESSVPATASFTNIDFENAPKEEDMDFKDEVHPIQTTTNWMDFINNDIKQVGTYLNDDIHTLNCTSSILII